MNPQAWAVLLVVFAAVVLFVTERLAVELVALLVLCVLLLSGILTPREGLAGFSNEATLTVGAMFVLSAALFKTGAVDQVGAWLAGQLKKGYHRGLLAMMGSVAVVSAFINNTAAVAVYLPLVLGAARQTGISPSRLLMPLSFASMFGGCCTLIGTSTNILVSSLAEQHGQRPFEMFEFSGVGLILAGVGTLYMLTAGQRLIPQRRAAEGELTSTYAMADYLVDLVLLPDGPSVGSTVARSTLVRNLDLDILSLQRDGRRLTVAGDTVLQAEDVLRVRCSIEELRRIKDLEGVALYEQLQWPDFEFESDELTLVEAVVAPFCNLVGLSLRESHFRNEFGGTVLAIRQRGRLLHQKLSAVSLKAGDVLLIELRRASLPHLRASRAFVVLSEVADPGLRRHKLWPAVLVVGAVVVTASLNLLPMVVAALVGAVVVLLLGCLDTEDVYRAIEWKVLFLLAGVLSLGVAMEKTGVAKVLAGLLVSKLGDLSPWFLLAAFYLATSLLTEAMSNNATAVLMAPVAIAAAEQVGIDSRPLLVAVTMAASASFMTPVGYQTNALIFGPGQYTFGDFLRVGTPLNLLCWAVATLAIPWFFPF